MVDNSLEHRYTILDVHLKLRAEFHGVTLRHVLLNDVNSMSSTRVERFHVVTSSNLTLVCLLIEFLSMTNTLALLYTI